MKHHIAPSNKPLVELRDDNRWPSSFLKISMTESRMLACQIMSPAQFLFTVLKEHCLNEIALQLPCLQFPYLMPHSFWTLVFFYGKMCMILFNNWISVCLLCLAVSVLIFHGFYSHIKYLIA